MDNTDWKDGEEPLKPRVSREERLRYRSEGCKGCRQDAPLRRRAGINPLFIVLILGVLIAYFLLGSAPSGQTLTIQKGLTLKWTAINGGGRQGLSMVLQNKSPDAWGVKCVIASLDGKAYTNTVDRQIAPGEFEASFLPLPLGRQKYKITVESL